jgi:hypothetical protein
MEPWKPIELPLLQTVSFPAGVTQVKVDFGDFKIRHDRCLAVLSAALAIEHQIEGVLKRTLFRQITSDIDFVVGNVLQSDWCSFSAKRKLLFAVINRDELLPAQDRTKLEKSLSKVIRYRNAFAHGALVLQGDEYVLNYFEGAPQSVKLDNPYWAALEEHFAFAFNSVQQIEVRLLSPKST